MIILAKKRALDRSKVIDQAIAIISDKGLSELTMPALAKALGIRSQSLYHYVANRNDLLLVLVCVNRLQVLRQHLTKKIIGHSGLDALFRFADEIRDFLLHDKAISGIYYGLNEYVQNEQIHEEVMKIVELGEKLDVDNKNIVSLHSLLGAVLGYVFLDRYVIDETEKEADDNYHEMLLRLVAPKLQVEGTK
mgnify:CR=1 FL=1